MGNVYWGTHSVLKDAGNATVLLVGDSWFWYPFDNLAVELGARLPNQVLLVVGRSGAEACEWSTKFRKDIDFAFKMFAQGASALLLSGGGNDIAGMNDFLRLLDDDCSGAGDAAACFRAGEPDTLLSMIDGCYRTLITKFRAFNPTAPIVVHHYDYAWPTGAGVFGPGTWLKAPMDRANVADRPPLRREILKTLVDGLRDRQIALSTEPNLGVHVAMTAGKLPETEDAWANELHPTPEGFRLLAREAYGPVLEHIGIA
jgi:hypothetical protein